MRELALAFRKQCRGVGCEPILPSVRWRWVLGPWKKVRAHADGKRFVWKNTETKATRTQISEPGSRGKRKVSKTKSSTTSSGIDEKTQEAMRRTNALPEDLKKVVKQVQRGLLPGKEGKRRIMGMPASTKDLDEALYLMGEGESEEDVRQQETADRKAESDAAKERFTFADLPDGERYGYSDTALRIQGILWLGKEGDPQSVENEIEDYLHYDLGHTAGKMGRALIGQELGVKGKPTRAAIKKRVYEMVKEGVEFYPGPVGKREREKRDRQKLLAQAPKEVKSLTKEVQKQAQGTSLRQKIKSGVQAVVNWFSRQGGKISSKVKSWMGKVRNWWQGAKSKFPTLPDATRVAGITLASIAIGFGIFMANPTMQQVQTHGPYGSQKPTATEQMRQTNKYTKKADEILKGWQLVDGKVQGGVNQKEAADQLNYVLQLKEYGSRASDKAEGSRYVDALQQSKKFRAVYNSHARQSSLGMKEVKSGEKISMQDLWTFQQVLAGQ